MKSNTLWTKEEERAMFKYSNSGFSERDVLDRYGKPGSPCPLCNAPVLYLPFIQSELYDKRIVVKIGDKLIHMAKLCYNCSKSEAGLKHYAVAKKFFELEKTIPAKEAIKQAMKEVGFEYEVVYED